MKIENLITSYLNNILNIKRYSLQTVKAYKTDLNQFLVFYEANNKSDLNSLTERFIKRYLMHLSDSGIEKRSISRKLSSVRGLFKFAYQNHLIDFNPSVYVKNPKSNKTLPEVTTTESILKIYKRAEEA